MHSRYKQAIFSWSIATQRRPSVLTGSRTVSPLSPFHVCEPAGRHGGRFSVNLKEIAQERHTVDSATATATWLLAAACLVLSAASTALVRSVSSTAGDGSERRTQRGGSPTMQLPVKLSPNSIRVRRSPTGQTACGDHGGVPRSCDDSDRFFLSIVLFLQLRRRWWLGPCPSSKCQRRDRASLPRSYLPVMRSPVARPPAVWNYR